LYTYGSAEKTVIMQKQVYSAANRRPSSCYCSYWIGKS